MGPLRVVVDQPHVQIGLQRRHGLVERGAEGTAEELVQDSPVEALDEALVCGNTGELELGEDHA